MLPLEWAIAWQTSDAVLGRRISHQHRPFISSSCLVHPTGGLGSFGIHSYSWSFGGWNLGSGIIGHNLCSTAVSTLELGQEQEKERTTSVQAAAHFHKSCMCRQPCRMSMSEASRTVLHLIEMHSLQP